MIFPIRSRFNCATLLTFVLLVKSQYFMANSTIITSVGYIFEAFSPYAMIQFFEFSDKGWNISENCLRDMYTYVEGLRKGAIWAIKLYDATSYYGGSAFGGLKVRIESPQVCRDLMLKYRARKERTVFDDVANVNSSVVPFAVQVIIAHYLLEFTARSKDKDQLLKIQQLICFPQSCTDPDLAQILAVQLFQGNDIIKSNSYLRHRIVYGNYNPTKDPIFYILITFLSVALFLYTAAFLLQIYFGFKHTQDTMEFDLESTEGYIKRRSPLTTNIEHLFAKKFQIKIIDMNWSIKTTNENLPKIVTKIRKHRFEDFFSQISIQNTIYDLFRSEEELPQLRLQFIFTILLIYTHLIAESIFVANNIGSSEHDGLIFLLSHSNYLFDSLLVLNASKLAFNYLQGSPAEKFNVFENLRYIFKLITCKILRHAPSYTICLFTAQMLDRYFRINIALELPSYDYKNCGLNNIFSTIFYWDIFFPLTERCMPWAWFMSLEVQFFMVACLVLLLTEIQPQYASIIGIGFFVISILGATFWNFNEKSHISHGNSSLSINTELAEFNLIPRNIFLSIPPYLTGLYLGYILHKTAANIKLNLIVLMAGYTGCIFIWIFFQFGFKIVFLNVPSLVSTIVIVLGHTIWSLVIMWIVLTSFSCYGDFFNKWLYFDYSAALETLSPICLLVAPILIRFFIFTADAPVYISTARIISAIQDLLRPHGILKSINKILGTEVLVAYNYFGVKGKKCFKDFKNMNYVLFEYIKTEGMTQQE